MLLIWTFYHCLTVFHPLRVWHALNIWELLAEYYHSNASKDHHTRHACERWKNWYVKQSHIKGQSHTCNAEEQWEFDCSLDPLDLILPAVHFQFSPKINTIWNTLSNHARHVWHDAVVMNAVEKGHHPYLILQIGSNSLPLHIPQLAHRLD